MSFRGLQLPPEHQLPLCTQLPRGIRAPKERKKHSPCYRNFLGAVLGRLSALTSSRTGLGPGSRRHQEMLTGCLSAWGNEITDRDHLEKCRQGVSKGCGSSPNWGCVWGGGSEETVKGGFLEEVASS